MVAVGQVERGTARGARALWAHVFGEGKGFLCIFSGRRAAPGSKQLLEVEESFWPYPQSATFAEQEAYQQDALGREVYFCAHLLREKRRRKEAATAVHSLWVDGDGALVRPPLPESTVAVSSSPGRHQYFWRLDRAVPPAEAEGLNRRLAYAMGADRGGWDLTQLVRVPGCGNHKYPDSPAVVVNFIRDDCAFPPAVVEQLAPPLPAHPSPVGPSRPAPDDIGDTEPPVRLDAAGLAWWRGERSAAKEDGSVDRSETLWGIARALWAGGASAGTVAAALAERDAALGYGRYTDRPAEYLRIVGKLGEAAVEPPASGGSCHNCARLEAELARERQEKEQVIALNRAIRKVLAKKELKQLGRAAIGIALDVQQRLNNTQETHYDPDGQRYVKLNNGTAGELSGLSDDSIGKATDYFKEKGLLDKKPKPTFAPYRDRASGEIKQGVVTNNYVALQGDGAVGFLEGVAALEDGVKWGGKRQPRPACEEHPDAGTITRTVVHCAMEACDQALAPPHEAYFTPAGEQAPRPLWTLIRDGEAVRAVDPWDLSPGNPRQNEETASCGTEGTESVVGVGAVPQLAGTP
jgi:hypothetical protein